MKLRLVWIKCQTTVTSGFGVLLQTICAMNSAGRVKTPRKIVKKAEVHWQEPTAMAYVCLMCCVCLLWELPWCNNCHATVKKKDDWVILLMGYLATNCNCQWVTSMLKLVTNCFKRWITVELILRRYSIYVKKFLSSQFQWALNTFSFDISNEYNVFTFSVCSIDWSV